MAKLPLAKTQGYQGSMFDLSSATPGLFLLLGLEVLTADLLIQRMKEKMRGVKERVRC